MKILETWYNPPLKYLYALKMSHRYLRNSPHFLKTMRDIQAIRKFAKESNYDLHFDPKLKEWFKKREKETYWYKHPSLKQNKKDFFNGDGVTYVYDHDSIHEAVKHLDEPAYNKFKVDTAEVECSKEKFFSLPMDTQLYSVLEEVQVLALERSQIPFKDKGIDPRWSFNKAHEKVCTSITSGWWREFAWEHYDMVQDMYEPDYVNNFWAAVNMNRVKPYKQEEAVY
jgi:hypothetical protein